MAASDEEWFDDDSFWVDTHPFMFPASSFEVARRQTDQIVALTGVASGSVLDLACGPGRHAVPLAERGFAVTAVDRSAFLIERGSELARRAGAEVRFVEQDMRAPLPAESFDLALCMFTSFGLLSDERDNRAVLDNVLDSLRPGGAFVLDVLGKELLAQRYEPTGSTALDDGRVLVQRRTVVDDWSRMDNEWMLIDGNGVRRHRVRHWLYSGRELRDLLVTAGFEEVALYGDLEGAPYGPGASRLIALARRPRSTAPSDAS